MHAPMSYEPAVNSLGSSSSVYVNAVQQCMGYVVQFVGNCDRLLAIVLAVSSVATEWMYASSSAVYDTARAMSKLSILS
jgi:hypothetical protein